ncbi:MAG: hypothetical protein IT379_36245 [Deltaproteobacteria bacterium]|nr:hypothetical protein [Deltaproteobacteria bacterium]
MSETPFDRDEAVVAMLAKYRELRRLRTTSAATDAEVTAAIRARAGLAARHPGSLREIDDLPLDDIDERILALEAAAAGGAMPEWLEPLARYHGWMRALLRAKRWLSRARRVDDALRSRFLREATWIADEPGVQRVAELLGEVASPPRGRLNVIVFREVAREIGRDPDEVRRALLPSKRERRGRTA